MITEMDVSDRSKSVTLRALPAIYVTISLVAAGGAAGIIIGISLPGSSGSLSTEVQTCPANTTILVNTTTYWACIITIDWSSASAPFVNTSHVYVAFHGVMFDVYGYNTIDCPVVNITGHETSGATFSFLIYPVPLNCQLTQPTVFSPDHDFGATWNGMSSVQLLVRFT
jgi:hypothetical protein